MNRRTFLTWMVLGWLGTTSPAMVRAGLAQVTQGNGVVFYVSPTGSDGWSGKLAAPNPTKTDGPFATLQRARDAIRFLKRQQGGALKQPVTVKMRAGTYFLNQPLLLQPEDSGTAEYPVVFAAFENETPTISGGKLITDWRKLDGNLWVAQLPDVRAGKWYFRLLRTGSEWAIRARYPKFDPKQPLTGGWLFAQWWGKRWEKGAFNVGVSLKSAGDRLEWRIAVPAAGDYRLWVSYKSADSSASSDERAAIRAGNSEPVVLKNLPSAGENYRWVQAATIPLSAGEQTLVWENIKDGKFDLDAFCLTDDSDWNPETGIRIVKWWGKYELQSPKEGKHLLIVQAEACDKAAGKEVTVPKPDVPGLNDRIILNQAKFPQWKNWDGAEVHIFPAWSWVNTILKVKSADKASHTLFVDCQQDIRPGNRFFIANVREALDSAGEWFLDAKTGELIYWPAQPDFPNVEVVAPAIDRLVVMQGDAQQERFVEYVHFRGITFTDTDYTLFDKTEEPPKPAHPNTASNGYYSPADAAIWLVAARQCGVENCTFVNLGGYAVRLEQRSSQNEIVSNTMAHLGQGGAVLLGNADTQPFNNLIAANDIHDCGLVYKHVAGVYVTTGSGNRIAHNRIHRMPRYGVSLKSYDENNFSHNNVVEFNEIADTNLETNDTGAIETLGRDRKNSGNIIRFNLLRNITGMWTNYDGEIISPYMASGVFLDDDSSGTTIYGNIITGTAPGAVAFSNGKENAFENNLFFVSDAKHQITLLQRDEFMKGNVFRRNIIVSDSPKAELWNILGQEWNPETLAECDFNLYWHTGGFDLAKTKQTIGSEANFAKLQAAGLDRNSLIADPLFVKPEKGDFRLQPNSPAFQLGFQPIPTERIGPEGFRRTQ
jgi:hypothetical protein